MNHGRFHFEAIRFYRFFPGPDRGLLRLRLSPLGIRRMANRPERPLVVPDAAVVFGIDVRDRLHQNLHPAVIAERVSNATPLRVLPVLVPFQPSCRRFEVALAPEIVLAPWSQWRHRAQSSARLQLARLP